MNKSELEAGMTVILRNYDEYIVGIGKVLLTLGVGKLPLGDYNEDLTYKDRDKNKWDIMVVRNPLSVFGLITFGVPGKILWKREQELVNSFVYNLKKDDLIKVYDSVQHVWLTRYFDNATDNRVFVWNDGCTSHTGYKKVVYDISKVKPYTED